MRNLGRTIVFIPARAGSKRVSNKNLRDLCGQPLLAYSIKSAKECFSASDIYVNSDSSEMLNLAKNLGVSGYHRDKELASDTATGDEFTIDFIRNISVDTLVMINPVCPLVTPKDISGAMTAYKSSSCDTLITCESTRMQVFCENTPININLDEKLAPTQNNKRVDILNWAVTIWDVKSFVFNFNKYGSAYIGKNRLLHPINPLHGLKISYESDFDIARHLISARNISSG